MAIEVGNIFEGKVVGLKPFGAFVSLPENRTGMVHISEVSNEFVQDIAAVLSEGQTVKVKVIGISPEGKIALSIKKLLPPPQREGGRGAAGAPHGERRGAPRPQGGAPRGGKRPPREEAPRVWQPKPAAQPQSMSFEDMLSRYKSQSEEKFADLDHETNNRRGGGYAPRSRRGSR